MLCYTEKSLITYKPENAKSMISRIKSFAVRAIFRYVSIAEKHRTHDKQDIIEAYKVKRKEQIGAFLQIRCEELYKACAVHASLKTDVKMDVHSCHEQVCLILVGMQRKSQKLIRFFEDGEVQSEKKN